MSTDLFFSQPVSPNPPAGIQSGSPGPSGLSQTSKIQISAKSPEGDTDNFLTTLKAVSRNGAPEKPQPADGQAPLSETTASIEVGEMDEETDPTVTPVDMPNADETDSEPVQIPSDWNSAGFIKVLEGLGLTDAIADSDLQQLTNENPADINQLAALKMLIERLQQNQSEPPDGRQTEQFPQLQQFLSNIRDGQIPLVIDDIFRQGLSPYQVAAPNPESGELSSYRSVFSPKQMAELEQINQWIRSLAPSLQGQKVVSDLPLGQGAADGKLTVAMPAEAGNVVWPAESSAGLSQLSKPTSSEALNLSSDVRPAESSAALSQLSKPTSSEALNLSSDVRPAESSAGLSQLSKPTSSEALNLSSDVRPPVTSIDQESLVKNGPEAESTSNAKAKELPGPWPGRTVNAQADIGNRVAPAHDQSNTPVNARDSHFQKSNPLSGDVASDSQSQKPSPASGAIVSDRQSQNQEPASGAILSDRQPQNQEPASSKVPTIAKFSDAKFSEYPAQGPASEEPLSRVFQETQLAKEGVAKVESASFEDNFAKIVKLDAGTNDNSQLNSSGQNTDKLAEAVAVKKEAEAGQGDLRTQTMDQIVRKAAIQLRNGQHEARIELKPDFLGHVRMQVISEHQQVTVRILAEHGFVKEMIEGNLHQLKADLQQQGLEVDKLEVTVSRDPEDSANNKDKLAQSKFRQGSQNRRNEDQTQEEQSERSRRSFLNEDKSSAVDFFA